MNFKSFGLKSGCDELYTWDRGIRFMKKKHIISNTKALALTSNVENKSPRSSNLNFFMSFDFSTKNSLNLPETLYLCCLSCLISSHCPSPAATLTKLSVSHTETYLSSIFSSATGSLWEMQSHRFTWCQVSAILDANGNGRVGLRSFPQWARHNGSGAGQDAKAAVDTDRALKWTAVRQKQDWESRVRHPETRLPLRNTI